MTGMTRREFLSAAAGAITLPAFAFAQDRVDLASIRTRAEWRKAREKILANMQLVMGELPKMKRLPVEIVRIESEDLPGFTRAKIKYLSEEGDYVPAYLPTPKNLKRRARARLQCSACARRPGSLRSSCQLGRRRQSALRQRTHDARLRLHRARV